MTTAAKRFELTSSGFAKISDALGVFEPEIGESIDTKQFTASTTPVKLTGQTSGARRRLYIRNLGRSETDNATIYIGGDANVSVDDGYPLYWLDEIVLDVPEDVDVYAVANNNDPLAGLSIMELA